ncbi:MAG: hypothetical protein OHK93_006736 [Ramalina farinacea]|uniref:Uncharacterized protein n=1 Tax=Ramalina farinacea TaxID=258253 RepID=A0AA43QM27_9LECA|nr:hypothetical protein [Ramalina farinacea]
MESNPFSSSPDPLGMSNENLFNASPTKTKQTSLSPRKPLGTATGNVQVQDFFVSTPPSKSQNAASRRDSKQQKNENESPWRIRLTLQADRLDGLEAQMSPLRLTEKRTTTTIPLKGGDDEEEEDDKPVKRGRGRPRKSIDSPMPRNGTPKPKPGDRRKTMLVEEMPEIGDCWAPTPPRKRRGRKKQSRQPYEEQTPKTNQKLVAVAITPKTRTPERTVKARPFSRSRSRSGRKEITPRKLAEESELESDSIAVHLPQTAGSSLRACTPEKPSVSEGTPSEQTSANKIVSSVEKETPALERSTLDIADENMWRSMLRKDSVSPASKGASSLESPSADPTESHQEFDTILESEGFSMVSVDSLQSVGSFSKRSEHEANFEEGASQEGGEGRSSELADSEKVAALSPPTSDEPNAARDSLVSVQTPEGLEVTPSIPSKPHPNTTISTRTVDEPMDGTPRMERVKRAGSALQDVPSPQQQAAYSGQTNLASPFNVRQNAGIQPELRPQARKGSTPTGVVMNDPFSGFSAATRRELRAGLRLGEELAKREQASSPVEETVQHGHLQLAGSIPVNLEKPPLNHMALKTTIAAPEDQVFRNSIGSNRQLPSPRSSEFDRDEDRMSWKAQTPNHPAESTPKAKTDTFSDNNWKIEYQHEKNAVVRQIQQANASQVIVINSDEEDEDSGSPECSSVSLGSEVKPGLRDPEPSEVLVKSETLKPHRSQLPSPWRRAGSQPESSESDLFWQPDQGQSEFAKKREQRRKQRELSQNSSLTSASPSIVEQKPLHSTHPVPKLVDHTSSTTKIPLRDPASPQTPKQTLISLTAADESTIDGVDHSEEDDSADSFQDSEEEESYPEEESEEWTRDCIQPTDELLQTQTSISLALDESAATVPLPGTPLLGPIDPALQGEVVDLAPELADQSPRDAHPPEIVKAPSSWFSTLTAPITSLFGGKTPQASHFPFPPISRSDILMSSPKESLPLLLPWTQAHSNALDPLYNASIIYHPDLFPYNPRSPCADLLGATIHVPNGWARKITETDCGVIDAFLVVMEARGYLESSPSALIRENLISCQDIAVQLVWLWVYMVTSGEVKLKDWQGVTVGRREAGDRTWTEGDTEWSRSRTKYFKKKRAQFEVHGLPSWWEKGLKGPFKF